MGPASGKQAPPDLGGGIMDLLTLLPAGREFRGLSLDDRHLLMQLLTSPANEIAERWFESEPIKAVYGFDGIVGNYASPYSPGSAYVLLHHVFGEVNGKRGAWGHAIGGMGAITQAMARCAAARGVDQFLMGESDLPSPVS